MALRFDASADKLTRSANLPSVTSFTICGVSQMTDRGSGQQQGIATWGPEALVYLVWNDIYDSNNMRIGSYNGVAENVTAFTSRPAAGTRFFWYIRCSGSGANLLQAGWMPFGDTSFTEQRSTTITSGTGTSIILNQDTYGDWSNQDMNAVRVWNVSKSDAVLLAEAASETAVDTTGLLIDSPMTGANVTAAAADYSGNGYNWTVGGTLAVVTGPTYSSGITATLTSTLGAVGLSSAGKVALKATFSRTIGAESLSSAGKLALQATLGETLGSTALTSVGGAPGIIGTAAIATAAIAVSSAGNLPITGATSETTGAASLAASGTVPIVAYLAADVGAASLSSVSALALQGQAAVTIGEVSTTSLAKLSIKATLAADLGAVDLAAAGANTTPNTANLSATMGAWTLSARGVFQIFALPLSPTTITAPALSGGSITAEPLSSTSITAPTL